MGDGHPSLAPQWLKSGGSLSLRPQTQGGTNSGNADESGRGTSWRDSGSRLGLGAGADREAFNEGRSQAPPAAHRERSSFTDRSNSRAYQPSGSERKGSFVRGSNVSSHRPLSDRELVEQMPSPKVRPGARHGSADIFFEEPYVPSLPHGDRAGWGRSHGNARKPAGTQRSAPVLQPRADREFSVLTKPAQPRSSSLLSPRQPPAEQSWTSRLADAGSALPQPEPLSPLSSPINGNPTNANDAPLKPAPRMADTILQAQATAAQEQEAAKAAKVRMEQLVLRQSKQLVPVMPSSKSKPASSAPIADRTLPTLKKSSGLEPLGKIHSPAALVRKEDESLHTSRSLPHSGASKPGLPDPAASAPSPKAASQGARPTKDKDRLTFFSSLRRKASGGEPQSTEDHGISQGEPEFTSALGGTGAAASEADLQRNAQADVPSVRQNGKHEQEPSMTPEELAFMRSLGWNDAEDHSGGGLTEEEIAAFNAQYPSCRNRPPGQRFESPLRTADKGLAKHMAGDREGLKRSQSLNSELAFSDSSSESQSLD